MLLLPSFRRSCPEAYHPLRKYIGIDTTHTKPSPYPSAPIPPARQLVLSSSLCNHEPIPNLSSVDKAFANLGLSANDYFSLLSDNREIITLSGIDSSDSEDEKEGLRGKMRDAATTSQASYNPLSAPPASAKNQETAAHFKVNKCRPNWRLRLEDGPKPTASREPALSSSKGLHDHHESLIRKLGYKSAAYIIKTARPLK